MANNGRGAAELEAQKIWRALDGFRIEIPSWGFANTGTRFGKFVQAGAATTIDGEAAGRTPGECADGCQSYGGAACSLGHCRGKADVPVIQGWRRSMA